MEKLQGLLSLMLLSGAFLSLYTQLAAAGRDTSTARNLWVLLIASAAPFQLRVLWPVMRRLLLGEPFCWMFALLAVASSSWSLLPDVTLRRATLYFLILCYAVYLSVRYNWTEFCGLARTALRLGLILSLVATLVRPDLGIHQFGILRGSWSGLYLHKNIFGNVASLLVALCWSQAAAGLGGLRWRWLDTILGMVVLAISGARTAIAVLVGVAFSLVSGRLWLRGSAGVRLALCAFGLLASSLLGTLLYVNFDRLSGMDWDRLLTGRVSLWRLVIYLVAKSPWIGYGFKSFFEMQAFGRMVFLLERWKITHAHNIFLEVMADLGVVGLLLYLCTLALFVLRLGLYPCTIGLLPLGVLVFNVLTGLTETLCYPDAQINGLVFVYFAFSISPRLRGARSQAYRSSSKGGVPADENSPGPESH
ncbi:MAG: O-antigen ligase family protein [Vulcanimicrobiota bacterium]